MEKFNQEYSNYKYDNVHSLSKLNQSLHSKSTRRIRPGYEVIQEFKRIEKQAHQEEQEQNQYNSCNNYLVSEGIRKESSDDFGNYKLFDNEYNKDGKLLKTYVTGNFMNSFNHGEEEVPGSPMELMVELLTQQIQNKIKINIESPEKIRSKTQTMKKTINQSINEEDEFDLIKNTENSRILKMQYEMLDKGDPKEARKENSSYNFRKVTYEIQMVQRQVAKYKKYLNSKSKDRVTLTSEGPFRELEKETDKLLNEYNEFNGKNKLNKPGVRTSLENFSLKSRPYLAKFMNGIIVAYENNLNEKRAASEKTDCYILWKTKISQLVGLWDISNSNGINMRTSAKYLIIKRFLTLRSLSRENNSVFVKYHDMNEKKITEMTKGCLQAITGSRNPLLHPILIFKSSDLTRKFMDVLVVCFLLYSFITVPVRLFMGIENNNFQIIEKFVDMYFYIDIMITLRTAFKDKYNEDQFDITEVTKRYLQGFFFIDFISSIPWYFFFKDSSWDQTIRIITHILKICRIAKLIPILNKLEELKQANYFRIMKLLLIFYLIAHWMAGILFFGVSNSIKYERMNDRCYSSNVEKTQYKLNNDCIYVISFYNAAYTIPGQFNAYMNSYQQLNPFNEYIILLLNFLIGQFLSAYVFGGMTSIIQNLDQGSNFFIEKTDLLREHIIFYEMGQVVQNDVTVYYDYLWQRHKDMIYGKDHFDLLSKSLREKFENFNLLGNEIYLKTFHQLNNPKLLGCILRELKKEIILPFEILYEEGSLVKGLYILINGQLEFSSNKTQNAGHSTKKTFFHEVMQAIKLKQKTLPSEYDKMTESMTVIFPLVSVFLKTGRTYQQCSSIDFADLLFLDLKSFDDIVASFPVEMHSLKHDVMHFVESNKLFDSNELFSLVSQHSARSIGKNYEKDFTKLSIWISIPIPISQRKIATSYIESFVKTVKNQWREILLPCDLNITLNSYMIINFLKTEKTKINENNVSEDKNVLIQNGDILDNLKGMSKLLSSLAEDFLKFHNNLK